MFDKTNLATFVAPFVDDLERLIASDRNEQVDAAAAEMFDVSEADVLRTCELYGIDDEDLKRTCVDHVTSASKSLAQVVAIFARSKAGI